MSIKLVNKSTVVRIYYKSDDLISDRNVIFNIWDDTGAQLESNTVADGEIGDKGIYYLDITTPDKDIYLLAKASVEGESTAPYVMRVGNPDQKVFYVDPKYRTRIVQPYEIYTLSGSVLQSGNLFESNGGFYFADVSSIVSGEALFFESGILSQTFEIAALAFTGEGGVILGGESQTALTFNFESVAEGGVIVSGEADATFVVGPEFIYEADASVPILIEGQAEVEVALSEYSYEATGGIDVSGESNAQVSAQFYSYKSSGGLILSGTASVDATFRFLGRIWESTFEIGDKIPFQEIKAIYYDGVDNYYVTGPSPVFGDLSTLGTVYREDQAYNISAYNARQRTLYNKIYKESLRIYNKLESQTGQDAEGGAFEIPVLSSDFGNILAQFAEISKRNVEALRDITPVPAQGSIYAISEEEEIIDLDQAAEIALSEIKKIREISPISSEGSLFAITENSDNELLNLNEALNKNLTKLNTIVGTIPTPVESGLFEVESKEGDASFGLSQERQNALDQIEKLKKISPTSPEGGKVEV